MDKNRLTFREAWKNFKEMKSDLEDSHIKEIKQKIIDKMVEERRRQKK
jgi:quinol monooxygenase YgiN